MTHKTMAYVLLGIWQSQAPDDASRAVCEQLFNEMLNELDLTEGTSWERIFRHMVHMLDETVNWHSAPWVWQPQLDADEKKV